MTSEDRRAALLAARTVNGIDFVEVDPNDPVQLDVHFVLNLPDASNDPVPPDSADALTAANFLIQGGERITTISVRSATRTADDVMHLTVDQAGDFSLYHVMLTDGAVPPGVPTGFDPVSASADFVFHIDCIKDVDCAATPSCPPEVLAPPPINYLAKDYPGFVQTMLDRMALLVPRWQERNAADLGVALVETLAYVADHLSYRQDVIATEAYLGTARLRTSIRRHARLVDYRIGEGVNARAWLRVLLDPSAADGLVLPRGTRCATAYPGSDAAELTHDTATYQQAIDASALFFETLTDSDPMSSSIAQMPLYEWSDTRACLQAGSTSATLRGGYPLLSPGMVIMLAEAKGPASGVAADADPMLRQPVRLTKVHVTADPLDGTPVTEIEWHDEDMLTFALPIASVTDAAHGTQPVNDVAVAWGNLVLADHGRRVGDATDPIDTNQRDLGLVPTSGRFRPVLPNTNLTFATAPPLATDAAAAAATRDSPVPVITAHSVDIDGNGLDWSATADLLDAGIGPDSTVFLPEIETDGRAYLLFGDGANGMLPPPGARFTTSYRIGNGAAGNCAREAIALLDKNGVPVGIVGVSNPMPAWGGVDPESIESVRQHAPVAFRTQQRAVTPVDYAERAMQYPGVKRAAATLRWTGSWHTVLVTVERDHQLALNQELISEIETYLDAYRMTGMDVEVAEATRVPLHIAMTVCVRSDYVAADVEVALLDVFSTGTRADGSPGLLSPDRLDLGAPFYLSPLIAAAQDVDGVMSVSVTAFERQDQPSTNGLTAGVLVPQRLEFFILDNDPNYPDRGRFELSFEGGL
jgi:hypothetical protein